MLDRQKIETILSRRFPGAKHDQVAAAANAIMGLGEDWEEVPLLDAEPGDYISTGCRDECLLARHATGAAGLRLLRRRESLT
jgi:hypothetical protein